MAGYNHDNAANRIKARKLLDRLMPDVEQKLSAKQHANGLSEASPTFRNMARHMSEEKLEGVHVYPGPKGGWHADLVFRGMPAGIPGVLGTPVAYPCSTRDDAVKWAVDALALMIALMREKVPEPGDSGEEMAVFAFDDIALDIPIALLDQIGSVAGKPPAHYVHQRLDEIRDELAKGQTLTVEVVKSFDTQSMAKLHSVVAMALLCGMVRWPENPHMPPQTEVTP